MKMKLEQLVSLIEGKVITSFEMPEEIEINGGYVSDLLSDVMGNAREGDVWITIMRHLNVVAVASLAGISAIIFAKGILPAEAVIQKANEEKICLISSARETFTISGILYNLLNT